VPSKGIGTVYSFTVVHRALVEQLNSKTPYIVAVVELAEGVRMMSNLINTDPTGVRIGMPVRLEFGVSWDGRPIPIFQPEID
jgi:uncharacterized OB-fold protein